MGNPGFITRTVIDMLNGFNFHFKLRGRMGQGFYGSISFFKLRSSVLKADRETGTTTPSSSPLYYFRNRLTALRAAEAPHTKSRGSAGPLLKGGTTLN